MATSHPRATDEGLFTPVTSAGGGRVQRRAQPRWEQVRTFRGTGPAQMAFVVAGRATQWKADWRCDGGRVRMTVLMPSAPRRTLADTACPGRGERVATETGAGRLVVAATGAWRVTVWQQVDTALDEPPLPGMTRASLLMRGLVHPVQKHGEGSVSLYRLGNGRLALRFERFYTTPSPGLQIWLSRARDPRSTLQTRAAPHVNGGVLRSTLGSYNQILAPGVSPAAIRSVVIWCPTVLIAFSAAPLGAP